MQGSSWAALTFVSATACAGGSAAGESPVPQIQMTAGQSDTDDETSETTFEATGTGRDTTTGGASSQTTMFDPSTTTGEEVTESSSEGGGAMPCANAGTCNDAIVLGTVSGDEPSPILYASGSEPTWLTFRVTENNDGLSGESLSFQATLTSPPGYDFDLYAFRGPDGGTTGCGGVADESTGVGTLDVVAMSWGEGAVANGGDESAWVAIQIEVKNGVCDPTAEWTLAVEGDV